MLTERIHTAYSPMESSIAFTIICSNASLFLKVNVSQIFSNPFYYNIHTKLPNTKVIRHYIVYCRWTKITIETLPSQAEHSSLGSYKPLTWKSAHRGGHMDQIPGTTDNFSKWWCGSRECGHWFWSKKLCTWSLEPPAQATINIWSTQTTKLQSTCGLHKLHNQPRSTNE